MQVLMLEPPCLLYSCRHGEEAAPVADEGCTPDRSPLLMNNVQFRSEEFQ